MKNRSRKNHYSHLHMKHIPHCYGWSLIHPLLWDYNAGLSGTMYTASVLLGLELMMLSFIFRATKIWLESHLSQHHLCFGRNSWNYWKCTVSTVKAHNPINLLIPWGHVHIIVARLTAGNGACINFWSIVIHWEAHLNKSALLRCTLTCYCI